MVNTALTPRIGRVAKVAVPGEELLRASNTFGAFNKSLQLMTEQRRRPPPRAASKKGKEIRALATLQEDNME